MIDTPQPIQPFEATIRDYTGLIDALRACRTHRRISNALIDELSGLQPGHAGKLLGEGQVKTLGLMSLGSLLGTFGVKLIMVDDLPALERMMMRWEQRARPARAGCALKPVQSASQRVAKTRVVQKEALRLAGQRNGKKGGRKSGAARMRKLPPATRRRVARQAIKARNAKMSPEQRSQSARVAALARWANRSTEEG